jgi:hypothetical protein
MDWDTTSGLTVDVLLEYRMGTAYTIAGPALAKEAIFVNYAKDVSGVSYKLTIEGTGNTTGDTGADLFCVNPATGKTPFLAAKTGTFKVVFIALDTDDRTTKVFEWTFTVVERTFGSQAWWDEGLANGTIMGEIAGVVEELIQNRSYPSFALRLRYYSQH